VHDKDSHLASVRRVFSLMDECAVPPNVLVERQVLQTFSGQRLLSVLPFIYIRENIKRPLLESTAAL